MNKTLYYIFCFSIAAMFTGCSSFIKSNTPTNSTPYEEQKEIFDHVSFYKDLLLIKKTVTDSNNQYYFEKLINKFLYDSQDMNEKESVALLYGALNHPGYGNLENIIFERRADSLADKKYFREAITTANKCLDNFPLSAKATMVMWYSYLNLEQKDSSDIYGNRLETIFEGMQASGYSEDSDRPQIALSKNAIEEYCNKHAAGAGLEFETEYLDEDGNLIVIYSSFLKEVFVIPKKE